MNNIQKHTIQQEQSVRDALIKLDKLGTDAILFVVDAENKLIGSLTDGDLRRGFIKGLGFDNSILEYIQPNPSYIREDENSVEKLESYRAELLKIIPVLDNNNRVVEIINFRTQTSVLPVDAVLMAGGEGKRLRPFTETTPKPLLKIGDKPIIEHNIDRLINVGIKNIHLSINYLGNQIEDYFGNGKSKNVSIKYIKEDKPLGTIGSILLADKLVNNEVLVMNSDLLTNIDFTDFYRTFHNSGADMAVAATTYNVDVPYAVLEADNEQKVVSLKEKPRYTYFSNAGIYLIKTSVLELIPKNSFFDITDLMEKVIDLNMKLITFPINGYWLDIGKHDDYKKAQEDIKHLKL